jgi:hypothetical protein
VYPAGPPSPYSARTVPEFLDRMRALKRWARLSYEALQQRADEQGNTLPHSSLNRLLAKSNDSKMPDDRQLAAFVLACGLSEEQWREWALVCADIQSTGEAVMEHIPSVLLERLNRLSHKVSRITFGDSSVFGKYRRLDLNGAAPTWAWSSDGEMAVMGPASIG